MSVTPKHQKDLEEKGYTVVTDILTESECDKHILAYRQWLNTFPLGSWPQSKFSIIQHYRTGHMEATWSVRVKTYPVFSQIWGTKKLLTSMDAVAIGRPPEECTEEEFWSPDQTWLHCDQSVEREGLHAYQGAVYLEDCDKDDWTFEVIEGSHKHFEDFHERIQVLRCRKVSNEDILWFSDRGCNRKRVPCPKGGIVLWDSRLIHANARPVKARANPDRWRFVVFVCMTPAVWATSTDLELKAKAYYNLDLTGHWASRDIIVFPSKLKVGSTEDPNLLTELPDIAKSELAKRLVGLQSYDVDENTKDPFYIPIFNREKWSHLS